MKSLAIVGLIAGASAFVAWWMLQSVLREVGRVILSLSLSAIFGVAVGALAAANADQLQISTITAIAFFVPTFLLVRKAPREPGNLGRGKQAGPSNKPPAAEAPRGAWFAAFRRKQQSQSFDDAWAALLEEAPWAANRLSVARRGCEQLRENLNERELNPETHDLLVFMRKRIPEFIGAQLQLARVASGTERSAILTDLIDLLERYAADCERRAHERLGIKESKATTLRARIEEYLASGPTVRF